MESFADYINSLPNEILQSIAIDLSPQNIKQLCLTQKSFNNAICSDNFFWHSKFNKDYGNIDINVNDWKKLYMEFSSAWIFEETKGGFIKSDNIFIPKKYFGISCKEIAFGGFHTAVLDVYGDVLVWGNNDMGQLGVDKSVTNIETNEEGNVIPEESINVGIKSIHVACGYTETYIIDVNYNIWRAGGRSKPDWYDNSLPGSSEGVSFEQLFDENGQEIKAKEISCGYGHIMFIDLENNVWSFGYNNNGQLGLGDNIFRDKPVQILNIKAKKIACGGDNSAIIDMNNDIFVFGYNQYGQLGLGTRDNKYNPTLLPNIKGNDISIHNHMMIVDIDGDVWSCGNNENYELGLGIDDGVVDIPRQIIFPDVDTQIKALQVKTTQSSSVILDIYHNIWLCGFDYDIINEVQGRMDFQKQLNENYEDYDYHLSYIQPSNELTYEPTILPGFKAQKIFSGNYDVGFIGASIN